MCLMDIGQVIQFSGSTIDRYTTLGWAMRWFGLTFSKKFWHYLTETDPGGDFPEGSYQVEPGDEYQGFISYRGSTGRFPLQLALCSQFNFMPALYFMYIACPILVALISLIPDPCNWENYKAVDWLTWQSPCEKQPNQRSWFIFRMLAGPILILIALFWHPVFSWFYRGQKYFVDKFCIHQGDVGNRCALGIMRLPLFLKNSKTLKKIK